MEDKQFKSPVPDLGALKGLLAEIGFPKNETASIVICERVTGGFSMFGPFLMSDHASSCVNSLASRTDVVSAFVVIMGPGEPEATTGNHAG